MSKKRTLAAPGWFTEEPPTLLGARCTACGAVFFPPNQQFCRNPACANDAFEPAPLSRSGRLWSYTTNNYAPPAPFVAPASPFEPFAVAAVELAAEQMVVLGQVPREVSVAQLRVGMPMELLADTLFCDAENEYIVWKWRPAQTPAARDA